MAGITSYIKTALTLGKTPDTIEGELVVKGYSSEDVKSIIGYLDKKELSIPTKITLALGLFSATLLILVVLVGFFVFFSLPLYLYYIALIAISLGLGWISTFIVSEIYDQNSIGLKEMTFSFSSSLIIASVFSIVNSLYSFYMQKTTELLSFGLTEIPQIPLFKLNLHFPSAIVASILFFICFNIFVIRKFSWKEWIWFVLFLFALFGAGYAAKFLTELYLIPMIFPSFL